MIAVKSGAAPRVVGRIDTGHPGVHTVGIDESTRSVWVVYSDTHGDWVQRLEYAP